MDREIGSRIGEEIRNIFLRHGLDPVPCGYSLSGRGVWHYDIHTKAGGYDERPPIDIIFRECQAIFDSMDVQVDGSGYGFVGDGWWFMHFIAVDYRPSAFYRLRNTIGIRLTSILLTVQHWFVYRGRDKLDSYEEKVK